MASKTVIDVARPILSQNRLEARRRAMKLYRGWWRTADFIFLHYRSICTPITVADIKKKVREEFEKNRHHTDLRVIDLIIFQGQNDLREVSALWTQENHLMGKWWRDSIEPKPNSFLSKFLSGSD